MTYDPAKVAALIEAAKDASDEATDIAATVVSDGEYPVTHGRLNKMANRLDAAISALAPCATPSLCDDCANANSSLCPIEVPRGNVTVCGSHQTAPDREAVRVRLVGELFESHCMSRTSCERVADAILAAIGRRS